MATIYYDDSADLSLIQGKQVAIFGYGSQGHAHALNLKDSGVAVRVALADGSRSRAKAEADGLTVTSGAEAAAWADVVMILAPDTKQRAIYDASIAPNLQPGNMLMFAHGFNIRYKTITPPSDVDVTLIAPKAPGHRVREVFSRGGRHPGVDCGRAGCDRSCSRPRAVLCQGAWGDAGRGHRDDVRRGDRDRPLRRADRSVRRCQRADQGGIRDAGRSRLSARDCLLRVYARAEVDRRPHLPWWSQLHAVLGQRHGGAWRLHGW